MASTKDFSVLQKLEALIRLQKVMTKLDQLQVVKGELPEEVRDLEDEVEGLVSRKLRIEEEINGIAEFIDNKKLAIEDGKQTLKKYEKQSEAVKNNREFEAITKEIEMQQLDLKLHEKHIKDALREISEKSEKLEIANKNLENKQEHLNEKRKELEKIIAETEKEETVIMMNVPKTREAVDERLLVSFDRIRENYRNGLSVVPVQRDACGGCFYSVPPQRQSEIKLHKKIISCENCGRILVDEDLFDKVTI